MKKLHAPGWDSMEDFDAIIQHKESDRRARLLGLRAIIESSCRSYTSTLGSSPGVSTIADSDARDDLVQCYETHTVGLERLKSKLDEINNIYICPYCDINVATTFDHCLPKRVFPEFSVCAYNLVRACHSCQNDERSTKEWCDDYGRRLLLHPYYDPIDDQGPLFVAKIDISTWLPRIDYALNEDLGRNVSWFKQLCTHWSALDLRRRYSKSALLELPSLMSLVRTLSRSVSEAQDGLKDYAEQECRSRGSNHWRVALYAAAADDAEFIRYALLSRSP